jgi:hypothetical protein
MKLYDELQDLSVQISELLVATADGHDPEIDRAVPEVLQALRKQLSMDAVFVSEFVDGQRVFRFVDRAPGSPELKVGDGGPLEESFCQRVVDGRLPGLIHDAAALPAGTDVPPTAFRVGAHLSTAIVLPNGSTYGTLCCFSTGANEQLRRRDLETLRMCAQLVARKLSQATIRTGRPTWEDHIGG